jgi:acetyltransferase EpsM
LGNKIIVGAGRQAVETYYLLEDIGLAGEVDAFAIDAPEKGQLLLGKPVISIGALLEQISENGKKPEILIAIGTVEINKRLTIYLKQRGFSFFNAISNAVNIHRQNRLGTGVTIAGGAILTCNISIGDNVLINIGCTISHDCIIGDYVNISPGCHLAGNVVIEEEVFIGTGATFIPKVKIGKGSIIAAGACVIRDVPAYTMVAGVPATVIKKLK